MTGTPSDHVFVDEAPIVVDPDITVADFEDGDVEITADKYSGWSNSSSLTAQQSTVLRDEYTCEFSGSGTINCSATRYPDAKVAGYEWVHEIPTDTGDSNHFWAFQLFSSDWEIRCRYYHGSNDITLVGSSTKTLGSWQTDTTYRSTLSLDWSVPEATYEVVNDDTGATVGKETVELIVGEPIGFFTVTVDKGTTGDISMFYDDVVEVA